MGSWRNEGLSWELGALRGASAASDGDWEASAGIDVNERERETVHVPAQA